MTHVELPRPLEEYFAFAELERHGDRRRFTITLPYLADDRLGSLQWWWRVSATEENLIGAEGLALRRTHEIERFRRHIDGWLRNTQQRLSGEGPIPQIAAARAPEQPPAKKVATDEPLQRTG